MRVQIIVENSTFYTDQKCLLQAYIENYINRSCRRVDKVKTTVFEVDADYYLENIQRDFKKALDFLASKGIAATINASTVDIYKREAIRREEYYTKQEKEDEDIAAYNDACERYEADKKSAEEYFKSI